jgi:hypothetical protein
MTRDYELEKMPEWSSIDQHNQSLFARTENAYLLDYDPIDNDLYFAECSVSIREIIMLCPKTRGIFRMKLNQTLSNKQVRFSS